LTFTPYIDPITGTGEQVDRCWVVSNKPISHEAVDLIRAGIGHAVYAKNVTFIGIDKLWELIETHMPFQANLQKLEDVRHDFETWDTHYRIEARIDGTGIQQTLAEKFPGAAQEKPLTFQMAFEFPDTEDGREQVKALERFHEAGAPVKIPAAYIKKLEYSDFLQQLYPSMTQDGFLQFGSLPHPKPLLLKCEIVCDDGDRFTIDYIHLTCIQAGQIEATLTNDNQPIPFRMQLVMRADGGSQIHLSLDHEMTLNVHQQFRQLQFLRCLSKPHTIHFIGLEIGMSVGTIRHDAGICEPPNEDAFDALAALDALQRRSGRLVFLPDRDLTEEEYKDINMLRTLLRAGTVDMAWHNAAAAMMITDENRAEQTEMLQRFANGEGFFYPPQEEMLLLFGQEYPLGPMKPLSLPLTLVNWPEIKALLDTDYCGEVKLKFVPRDDGSFTKEYVKWLPEHNDAPTLSNAADSPSE